VGGHSGWPGADTGRAEHPRGRRGWGRRGELDQARQAPDAEHLGGERQGARLVDACGAIAPDQTEERIHLAHPRPGQLARQERLGELADVRAVVRGLAGEVRHVPQGINGLLGGEVGAVEGTAPRRHARMDLDADGAVVEADRGPVGARPEDLADIGRRQRVEGAGDLGVLVAGHLRLAPERDVIRRRGRGPERRLFHRL
jgi:hypothetical protein